jgi:L-asparaginase II
MDEDPKGYELASHPAQREISAALAEVTGANLGEPAIDGCSIPSYAIPLENLARGFARMATGEGLSPQRAAAARRLIDACTAEPFMMAGTGRFDTAILEMFGNRVFVKSGAEGVFCAAFPSLGLGVAIKCDDGAMRGAETVMATVIDALLRPADAERDAFARLLRPSIVNRVGTVVGEMRAVAGLGDRLRVS